MPFIAFVVFFVSVGACLSLSAGLYWQATGRMMLAVGAISSVSAYSLAIAANANWHFLACIAVGLAAGGVCGFLVSQLGRRLVEEHFLLLALALSEVTRRIAFHSSELTGGAYGLRILPAWTSSFSSAFWAVALLAVGLVVGAQFFLASPRGLAWRTAGGARNSAILMGFNPRKIESRAGILMGLAAAVAGIAHVLSLRYLHPDDLGIPLSLSALAVAISARARRFTTDVILLATVLFGLREILRLFDWGGPTRFAIHEVLLGGILVFISSRLNRVHAP